LLKIKNDATELMFSDGHIKAVDMKRYARGLLNESGLWCYPHRHLHI